MDTAKHSLLTLCISSIDKLTNLIGQSVAWLTLVMMIMTTAIVVLRYIFNVGSIAAQESVSYLHATIFMLGAAYTLKRQGHVRVDIFYRRYPARTKAIVDCFGTLLLLLPTCCFIIFISFDYIMASWSIQESSQEAGGLPAVYLLKSLIPLMGVLLIIQGIAEFLRNLLVIIGINPANGTPATGTKSSTAETLQPTGK